MKFSPFIIGIICGFLSPISTSAFTTTPSSLPLLLVLSNKNTNPTTPITTSTIQHESPQLPSFTSLSSSSSSSSSFGFGASLEGGTIDVMDENAQRDIFGMEQWALSNGVQKADGVELYSSDGIDWQLISTVDIPAGSPILYVPANMVISSNNVIAQLGSMLEDAEDALVKSNKLSAQRLPLFRLFVWILMEYEKGQESPYYTWLNSLPRLFYNGVAMTETCFELLPPYAASLAATERQNYLYFRSAIRKKHIPLNKTTMNNERIAFWAYNVAMTRFYEVWQPTRQKLLAPYADMFNHATNPNVEVTFDDQGNCNVYAVQNIPANSPLTISLGNPTNPTPIFAKYGFLYNDCRTIFCKAMHLKPQIQELGYDFKDLLFQVDSGEVAPKVYDIFLYKILLDNDGNLADQFYSACRMNDEETKNNFHQQYVSYTLEALKEHVGTILQDVDRLNQRASTFDVEMHPRIPVIVAHNNLVKETFSRTQAFLQNMG